MAIRAIEVDDDSPYVGSPIAGDIMYRIDHGDNRLSFIMDWIEENIKKSHRVAHDGYATSIWFYDYADNKKFVERWLQEKEA